MCGIDQFRIAILLLHRTTWMPTPPPHSKSTPRFFAQPRPPSFHPPRHHFYPIPPYQQQQLQQHYQQLGAGRRGEIPMSMQACGWNNPWRPQVQQYGTFYRQYPQQNGGPLSWRSDANGRKTYNRAGGNPCLVNRESREGGSKAGKRPRPPDQGRGVTAVSKPQQQQQQQQQQKQPHCISSSLPWEQCSNASGMQATSSEIEAPICPHGNQTFDSSICDEAGNSLDRPERPRSDDDVIRAAAEVEAREAGGAGGATDLMREFQVIYLHTINHKEKPPPVIFHNYRRRSTKTRLSFRNSDRQVLFMALGL